MINPSRKFWRYKSQHLSLSLILIHFFFIFSCTRSTKKETSPQIDYEGVAKQVLGSGVRYVENQSGEFFLCIKESKDLVNSSLDFMVLSSNGQIMVPKSSVWGSVSWFSEHLLKIEPHDRVKKRTSKDWNLGKEDNSYILNVKTNERVIKPKNKL